MDRIERLRNKLKKAKADSTERVDILNELLLELFVVDIKEAEEIAKESAALSKKLNYTKGLCLIPLNKGALYFNREQQEKAREYLLASLKQSETCSYEFGRAGSMFLLGLIEWSFGAIEKGFEYEQQALQIGRKIKHKYIEGWALNVLGGFYYDLKDHQSSLECFEDAWSIFNRMRSLEGEARALNGLGNNHLLMGNPEKALQLQKRCLKRLRGSRIKQVEARALHDLANIYKELGNYDNAEKYYKESLDMRRAIRQVTGEITTLLCLGELSIAKNEIEAGRRFIEEALRKAVKINARQKICRAHQNLSTIFAADHRFDEALNHYKKFHTLEKEIYHEAADKKLKHLQAVHQLEKSTKEAEIYRLRNVELKNTNIRLKQLLKELQATQTQLIHSEKMATLGKLAAGIAHEINSPIGAISSTNQVTQRCLDRILEAVDSSIAKSELGGNQSYQTAIQTLRKNAGLVTTAADRIVAIIKNLKNFVRLDEAELQKVDVHEGIENALALVAHELNGRIKVVKSFGKVPQIYCFPGELNQVFMILLTNAIQAIAADGRISIKTYRDNEDLHIQISDNGRGIKQDKLKSLFEFDFSQSGDRVKLGTGLLIAKNIVQKHKGTIRVNSKIGTGSTFTLSLPIEPNVKKASG